MVKSKKDTLFWVLLLLGLIIVGASFTSAPFSTFAGYTSPSGSKIGLEFTGKHATMVTIGFILIIAAFVFKYKKFPRF